MFRRCIKDGVADGYIWGALFCFAASVLHPALGIVFQFLLIALLLIKCDIKTIPALTLLVLGKGNLRFFSGEETVLHLGITWTCGSFLTIATFFIVLLRLNSGRFDNATKTSTIFWFLSFIPAVLISFFAKQLGATGIWSEAIMLALVPSVYYWGVLVGETYEDGKRYFATRMVVILFFTFLLKILGILRFHSFMDIIMPILLLIYMRCNREFMVGASRIWAWMATIASLAYLIFARGMQIENHSKEMGEFVSSADKYGNTFTGMAVFVVAFILAIYGKRISVGLFMKMPVLFTIANICLVSIVIAARQDMEKEEDSMLIEGYKYETLGERFRWKLFGDRGYVWSQGWEDATTPPLIIKDVRQRLVDTPIGYKMKLLPHNQFLTLLANEGWWLGLYLSLFIIWIQVRAFRAAPYFPRNSMIWLVFLPLSVAVYGIVGTSGQGVVGSDMWNGLGTVIIPGIVYGHWVCCRKERASSMTHMEMPYYGSHG